MNDDEAFVAEYQCLSRKRDRELVSVLTGEPQPVLPLTFHRIEEALEALTDPLRGIR